MLSSFGSGVRTELNRYASALASLGNRLREEAIQRERAGTQSQNDDRDEEEPERVGLEEGIEVAEEAEERRAVGREVCDEHVARQEERDRPREEAEKEERIKAFEGYTVTEAMMSTAATSAGFYHCLPAYRGYEVSAEVIDGPNSHVILQAHNRLHAARGALAFLMGVR